MEEDIKKALALLERTNGLVLDVGTGAGKMAEALALSGYNVISIEYDKNVLERTRQRISDDGINNIVFINGDAHSMPFLDNTFNIVVTYNAIHHMTDYKKVLREMVRVCKNSGTLLITELNQRGKEKVAKMHKERGIHHEAKIDIKDLSNYLNETYGINGRIESGEYIDIFYALI